MKDTSFKEGGLCSAITIYSVGKHQSHWQRVPHCVSMYEDTLSMNSIKAIIQKGPEEATSLYTNTVFI